MAEQAGLPENTARRYASVFRAFFPTRMVGRVKKYPTESLGILLGISRLSKQGLATPEIAEALQQEYPQTIESNPPPDSPHHPAISSSPAILLYIDQDCRDSRPIGATTGRRIPVTG